MPIEFINPPETIISSGTKKGVELGGVKSIISVDGSHNLYKESNIFTELSWAEFYQEEGINDQIDTFTTQEYESVHDDPKGLVKNIVESIDNITKNNRIFYGIADFEVDAFMNKNCVVPGLTLDLEIINTLLDAHKKNRDEDLFPKIIHDVEGIKKIRIEFQGSKRKKLHIQGSKLEDISEKIRMAKGFATGIVCTSRGAANLYIMSDNIVFKEDELSELYIDKENVSIIEMGIKRELLFPISWFRIDLGIRSLETLELWNEIKEDPRLMKALDKYDKYITNLVYEKYKLVASGEKIGRDLTEDFSKMTIQERRKALRDMEDAIRELTRIYKD